MVLISPTLTTAMNSGTILPKNRPAKLVGVIDGDTIDVLDNQHSERIRLSGIDCPENDQAYGQRAKQAASELVFCKDVTLETHCLDKYGRTLVDVLLLDGDLPGQIWSRVNVRLDRNQGGQGHAQETVYARRDYSTSADG